MSQDDYRVLHTTSKTCNLVDLGYNHKQARIVPPWSLDSLIIHDSELGQSVVQGCINLRNDTLQKLGSGQPLNSFPVLGFKLRELTFIITKLINELHT